MAQPVPPGNSKKWHNRRWSDSLGYYRARTMSNSKWHDPNHLAKRLKRLQSSTSGRERELVDNAARMTIEFANARKRGPESDEQYATRFQMLRNAMFDAVDALLKFQDGERRECKRNFVKPTTDETGE